MGFPDYIEWLRQHEASAFTRARHAAALGLGPPMAPAAMFSRSTPEPWIVDKILSNLDSDGLPKKRVKRKKRKKRKNKRKDEHSQSPSYELDYTIDQYDAHDFDTNFLSRAFLSYSQDDLENGKTPFDFSQENG